MQANRVLYFKYMWTPLPSDGSVVCQSPDVQTTVGFVQGGSLDLVFFPSKTVSNEPHG